MRHALFFLVLGAALLLALALSFPFMMSECQLSGEQTAIDRCFDRNAWGLMVYSITATALFVASLFLYIRASKWALLAAAAVGVMPLSVVLLLSQI